MRGNLLQTMLLSLAVFAALPAARTMAQYNPAYIYYQRQAMQLANQQRAMQMAAYQNAQRVAAYQHSIMLAQQQRNAEMARMQTLEAQRMRDLQLAAQQPAGLGGQRMAMMRQGNMMGQGMMGRGMMGQGMMGRGMMGQGFAPNQPALNMQQNNQMLYAARLGQRQGSPGFYANGGNMQGNGAWSNPGGNTYAGNFAGNNYSNNNGLASFAGPYGGGGGGIYNASQYGGYGSY